MRMSRAGKELENFLGSDFNLDMRNGMVSSTSAGWLSYVKLSRRNVIVKFWLVFQHIYPHHRFGR